MLFDTSKSFLAIFYVVVLAYCLVDITTLTTYLVMFVYMFKFGKHWTVKEDVVNCLIVLVAHACFRYFACSLMQRELVLPFQLLVQSFWATVGSYLGSLLCQALQHIHHGLILSISFSTYFVILFLLVFFLSLWPFLPSGHLRSVCQCSLFLLCILLPPYVYKEKKCFIFLVASLHAVVVIYLFLGNFLV